MAAETPTGENKKLKYGVAYLALGALTLVWSAKRAAAKLPVWPGLLDANGKPPGAQAGAVETVALWPLAAYYNATAKAPAPATPTTTTPSTDGK